MNRTWMRTGEATLSIASARGYRTVSDIPADAARIFNDAMDGNAESSTAWFANLERTVFPKDAGVRYYVARTGTQWQAILPVRLVRHRWTRRIEALGNFYTSLYAPTLSATGTALDLAVALNQAIHDHDDPSVIQFAPMDPEAPAHEALLAALRTVGWIPFRYFCFGNWYLKVETGWQDYLMQRDGQLRSITKRKGKKFSAVGGTLEIVTGGKELETGIEAYNAVYAASWKKPEPYPEFVPGLVRWLAAEGWLRLGIARINGRAVAVQIWIAAQGKASIFKLAYDEAYAEYAPGTLLTAHLMKHVIERDQVLEVDYLIGDDPYKASWMSHRRERWGIVAYNPRTAAGLALMIREIIGRTWGRLSGKSGRQDGSGDTKQASLHQPPVSLQQTTHALAWSFFPATDFAKIEARWQALCDRTLRTPLLSADFVGTALRHFGRGDELVCLAEDARGTVAGTILQRKNKLTWQTFQPSQMPLGPWLQDPGNSVSELAISLLRQLPQPTMILALTQLDPDFYRREDGPGCMTLDSIVTGRTELSADMEQFMATGSVKKNPKLAAELMRRMRKAEKQHGAIVLDVETAPEAAKDFVNGYAAIENKSWKAAGGTALAPDDAQARFYADLMTRLAHGGAARMYTLRFGDVPVARQIAIAGGDTLVLLKTTYEPEFRSLGPGVMQMYRLIEDAHSRMPGPRVIEPYGPFNDSQKLWSGDTRRIYHANIYRLPGLAYLHRTWMKLRRRGRK